MDRSASDPKLDQILARAAQGNPEAWRMLVDAYSKRVYALILMQCKDRELAEEITQATFVKVVTKIGKYSERGKFEPWLFRIATNALRDELRRQKRQARPMDMRSGSGEVDEPSSGAWAAVEMQIVDSKGVSERRREWSDGDGGDQEDPLQKTIRAEQIGLLRRAISQMSEADQEILLLRHTAGLSFPQIAQSLEQPLGTVLARGHRALEKLRKLLGGDEKA